MFNPFSPLSKHLLDAFVRSGKRYFVRQTLNRGRDQFEENIKGSFIFTHYSDIAHAQHHILAISEDPYKFMYEWDNPEHRDKLRLAADSPAGYRVYSAVFERDWEKRITNPLKEKVRKYIEHKLGWKPGRAETVDFNIYVSYGELYAKLKLRSQEVRVKLHDIETL